MAFQHLIAVVSLIAGILAMLVLGSVTWLSNRLGLELYKPISFWWHRFVLWLLDVNVTVHGAPTTQRPLLLVSNHLSYLDISILTSIIRVSFVAKSDLLKQVILGGLARLQHSIFVDRERRNTTGQTANEIARRLASGDTIVLFAEGLSSSGNRVWPFKSALFGAVHRSLSLGQFDQLWVQPVSIAATSAHGIPLGYASRRLVSWYDESPMASHLYRLALTRAIDIHVSFAEPIAVDAGSDRKAITRLCEEKTRAMLVNSLRGNHALEPIAKAQ